MTPGLQVEVEIDLAGHPLVVEFGQQRRDQAQAGIHVGEDAGHSGASSQFPVSGSRTALLPPRPLRTVRASFPAYGSSLCKAPFDRSRQFTYHLGCGAVCGSSGEGVAG